jgi:N-(5-amino-5-carboxypentanoyl)-L-cysteinyl-D-valine synthase
MLAIEMAGGVYCPLSPRDPQHRLKSLLEQTQSHLVFIHYLTKTKFQHDTLSIEIDSVVRNNNIESDDDIDLLTYIVMTPDDIAYTIFTSGSTGTPKAVSNQRNTY